MHCGERLRALRKHKGFTQRGLASQADLYFTTISKIENGERKLTLEEAVRVAEALGVDLYDLAGVPLPPRDSHSDITTPLWRISSNLQHLTDELKALAVH